MKQECEPFGLYVWTFRDSCNFKWWLGEKVTDDRLYHCGTKLDFPDFHGDENVDCEAL
jgi:hypothetical protein